MVHLLTLVLREKSLGHTVEQGGWLGCGQCWHCHPLLNATDVTTWAQCSSGIAHQSMLSIKMLLGLIAMLFCVALGNHTNRGLFQGGWQGKFSCIFFLSTALHEWMHSLEVLTRKGHVCAQQAIPKIYRDKRLFSVLHNLWFAASLFSLPSVATQELQRASTPW